MYKQIEKFYKDNYRVLLKRLNRRAGGVENAEDVLQESFYRALKYHRSFDPTQQELGAWFNRIMNNTLSTFQREQMQGGATIPYDEHKHEETYECSGERRKRLEEVINSITNRARPGKDILYLYFIKGFKFNEIRDITGENYTNITTLIYRFKADLIEEIGDERG